MLPENKRTCAAFQPCPPGGARTDTALAACGTPEGGVGQTRNLSGIPTAATERERHTVGRQLSYGKTSVVGPIPLL
ncbi:hypothetical protein CEXT_74541 [Caerostris extrusa]|uniref:Uncharacterized protein n=1 Tax=Caerostris extrusa TaxID=172846 RepID=A0AAV4T467_CAEEX|nr:hypothetical protein CEXT_74541 [Caerostris extrusa]